MSDLSAWLQDVNCCFVKYCIMRIKPAQSSDRILYVHTAQHVHFGMRSFAIVHSRFIAQHRSSGIHLVLRVRAPLYVHGHSQLHGKSFTVCIQSPKAESSVLRRESPVNLHPEQP